MSDVIITVLYLLKVVLTRLQNYILTFSTSFWYRNTALF